MILACFLPIIEIESQSNFQKRSTEIQIACWIPKLTIAGISNFSKKYHHIQSDESDRIFFQEVSPK